MIMMYDKDRGEEDEGDTFSVSSMETSRCTTRTGRRAEVRVASEGSSSKQVHWRV